MYSLVSRYSRSTEEERKQERQAQRDAAKKQQLEEFYPVAAAECIAHLAPATRDKTMAQWREWSIWCDANGVAPLHATLSEVISFLTELVGRIATTTMEKYCATIAVTYEAAASDVTNPARHILVRKVIKGLCREKGRPPPQMTGLTDEDYARIQVTARRPKAWETEHQAYERGTLDLALIGVMRDGLLRAGEAAALRWADLQKDEDGSGTLYIARSKTDQEGQGAVTYVSRQTMRYLRKLREQRDPETEFNLSRFLEVFQPESPVGEWCRFCHFAHPSPEVGECGICRWLWRSAPGRQCGPPPPHGVRQELQGRQRPVVPTATTQMPNTGHNDYQEPRTKLQTRGR